MMFRRGPDFTLTDYELDEGIFQTLRSDITAYDLHPSHYKYFTYWGLFSVVKLANFLWSFFHTALIIRVLHRYCVVIDFAFQPPPPPKFPVKPKPPSKHQLLMEQIKVGAICPPDVFTYSCLPFALIYARVKPRLPRLNQEPLVSVSFLCNLQVAPNTVQFVMWNAYDIRFSFIWGSQNISVLKDSLLLMGKDIAVAQNLHLDRILNFFGSNGICCTCQRLALEREENIQQSTTNVWLRLRFCAQNP